MAGYRLDPALAADERLFFEIYARALHVPEWAAAFQTSVIDAWDTMLVRLFVRHGFSRAEARLRARLALDTTRGLLLDLLLTGDRRRIDKSAERFLDLLLATDRSHP